MWLPGCSAPGIVQSDGRSPGHWDWSEPTAADQRQMVFPGTTCVMKGGQGLCWLNKEMGNILIIIVKKATVIWYNMTCQHSIYCLHVCCTCRLHWHPIQKPKPSKSGIKSAANLLGLGFWVWSFWFSSKILRFCGNLGSSCTGVRFLNRLTLEITEYVVWMLIFSSLVPWSVFHSIAFMHYYLWLFVAPCRWQVVWTCTLSS